ncbi:hypothetical protein NQZ68_025087 [Dissostichus eleginoides]|nr:hypothetical protein NQZ68_025087 [Dissostichus eleginoides]
MLAFIYSRVNLQCPTLSECQGCEQQGGHGASGGGKRPLIYTLNLAMTWVTARKFTNGAHRM